MCIRIFSRDKNAYPVSSILAKFYLLTLFITLNSCKIKEDDITSGKKVEEEIIAIKNVTIIPMTEENEIIENATIVVKNKTITSINKTIPEQARIINGKGKWLIPGLIDMHVHNLNELAFNEGYPTKGLTDIFEKQHIMTPYIVNGVTTVFELSGRVGAFELRNKIVQEKIIGPRIAIAAVIDGAGNELVASTPIEGRQTVRNAKGLGYRFIKTYSDLTPNTFKAIVDEAKKQGMKVVGHIPRAFINLPAKDFFIPHFGLIAHAEELSSNTNDFSYEKAQEYARLAKENGTWLTPNLSNIVWILRQSKSLESIHKLPTFQYVHPLMQDKWLTSNSYHRNASKSPKLIPYFQELIDFHKLIVKAFKEAGVPLVAGTDTGISGVVWGYSLHEELELLVEAGLTNQEALMSATRLPAIWLEIEDKIGTIEEGKLADLILLDKNPLEAIKNTKAISGVFVNGKWVDKKKINTMLSDLAEWNNVNREKFKWKDRAKY